MDDVLVVKAADHMDNGVCHADVGKELVAQALAPAGALDKASDIHEFNDRGGRLFRVVHLRELVQPRIRYGDHPHVGVDGAEGIIGALRTGIGDGVEQGRFADVGQTYNA